jgi:hypothetical protein
MCHEGLINNGPNIQRRYAITGSWSLQDVAVMQQLVAAKVLVPVVSYRNLGTLSELRDKVVSQFVKLGHYPGQSARLSDSCIVAVALHFVAVQHQIRAKTRAKF